jgi:hypothetical protein
VPGPPPARSEQRRRRNEPATGSPVKAPAGEPFEVPPPGEGWHEIARRWYESLGRSGQSAFYEESDWLTAFAVAESMSREFKPQPLVVGKGEHASVEMVELPPKAASLTAWLKAAGDLLATEGNRRRVALELQRPKPEEGGDVSHLDDARQRLRGA